jgi:ABC-type antimicrobial peptide transport system permease subunit
MNSNLPFSGDLSAGSYTIVGRGVAQRVREFWIRQALGADRASILSLVLRQGVTTAAAGVAMGLGVAIVAARRESTRWSRCATLEP